MVRVRVIETGSSATVAYVEGDGDVFKFFLDVDERDAAPDALVVIIDGLAERQRDREVRGNLLVLSKMGPVFVRKFTPLVIEPPLPAARRHPPPELLRAMGKGVNVSTFIRYRYLGDMTLNDIVRCASDLPELVRHLRSMRGPMRELSRRKLLLIDLHEDNVVVGPDGVARLIDFADVVLKERGIYDYDAFVQFGHHAFFAAHERGLTQLTYNEKNLLQMLLNICKYKLRIDAVAVRSHVDAFLEP
jgi:hypothetical protein